MISPQLRMAPVASLKFNPRNSREHSEAQIKQLAAAMREFGFTIPVLVDEAGMLLAGEGRVRAAMLLGLETVPAIDAVGWSDVQKAAYTIADNKIAANSSWREDVLREELVALRDLGLDLDSVGFSSDELQALLNPATSGVGDPEFVPPTPPVPVSAPGDLWRLGSHRLLCGDCTVAANVERLLAGARPLLMVTDPPYGVKYDPSWRARAGVGSEGAARGAVLNDDRADWREAWALFPGDVAYVWHSALFGSVVQASLEAVKFAVRSQIVWVKARAALSRGHFHWQHEPAFYAVREGAADDHWRFGEDHELAAYAVRDGKTAHWRGGRKQSTVWSIDHVRNETGHGTQKPIDCMRRPIENNSAPGAAVYDPFLGSGTTLIAAAMSGRVCYGLELNPVYVDVIVDRWQQFTGLVATRDEDGATLEDLRRAAA